MARRHPPVERAPRDPVVSVDPIELARLFLSATEPTDVLDAVARAACERTSFRRSVIMAVDPVRGLVRGRAGFGVDPAKVVAAGGPVGDYPVIPKLTASAAPLVVPASEVADMVPDQCLRPQTGNETAPLHFFTTSQVNIYPPPQTVLIRVGFFGSGSIFFRRRLT